MRRDERRIHTARAAGRPPFSRPAADAVGPFSQDRTTRCLDEEPSRSWDSISGSSAVKAIELKPVGKGYKVTAFGSEPIPPDSIVDGAIIDGGTVPSRPSAGSSSRG